MNRCIPIVIVFLFFCFSTRASVVNDGLRLKSDAFKSNNTVRDSLSSVSTSSRLASKSLKVFRNFKSLDKYDTPLVVNGLNENFSQEGFLFNTADALVNQKWLDMAINTFDRIEQSQNYVDLLSDDSLGELPVAIRPIEISNVKYTVGIAKAVFKPAYTEMIVFLKVETPKGTLILGANNVKLSHEGGIIGDAKLNLISQFRMNINNGKAVITLNGSFEKPATYATIDCSGFKELGIDADLKFSEGLLYPVDNDGKKTVGYVEGNFKAVVSDWNDIVANIDLPEFGLSGLEGTTFKINTAILDFSDLRNDEAMPQEYLSKYYSGRPDLWRGVYIKTLDVILPKAFKKRQDNKRVAFRASNLIIDDQGVTGTFLGENIISIDEGSASKWKFSLDHFLLEIETNSIRVAEFNGELMLPVSGEDRLKYDAVIRPNEYLLRVTNTDEIDFDVFNAKTRLTKDSYVEMKVEDGVFRPKAMLNGSFGVESGLKKDSGNSKTVDFKGVVFEGMVLQTESPKLSVDYFGYQGKQSLANFPVTINEIALQTTSVNQAELVFDISINLTSEGDGGNGGGARLAIKAKLQDQDGRDKWKYDGIDLERINVNMEVAGLELKGAVFIFEDDEEYGTGFAGAVGAKFSVGMSLEVEAKALFGKKDDFRYWFADANVKPPRPLPVFAGFSLNSFGGGFYNHMKMAGVDLSPSAAYNTIGTSTSGVVYEPYKQNGFGMKATVGLITTGSEELFHGSLEFGISFLRSGGLQEVYFKGEGEMISGISNDFYEKLEDKLALISQGDDIPASDYRPEGRISANVFIKFDFVNDVFHGSSELYLNFGILEGVDDNGRAGKLDFYVARDEWHLLIGTPKHPVGVKMNLGPINLTTAAYFMAGDNIPGSPPPPDVVADILGLDISKLDYTRDLNMLESGKGLAFGSHWSMSTGNLKFLIFYASFSAGLGFDIMVKDYGEARCKGSSDQIGLNGWYANGQAYGYFQGEIGLKFKIFGKRKKITIFKGAAAALMQARLPNPIWLRGYVGGKYSVLGGLIKGRFRFKIELGDKCEVIGGSPLDGIVVIGDMAPKDESKDVDVFALPQVSFNLQVNKIFELPDDSGDHKYKILLDKFELTKDGKPIEGEVKWNKYNSLATFYSHEILPPKSDLKAYVQLHFEEQVNGAWEVIKNDGEVSLETKEITFTTGTAPKTIPPSNIEYMYPVKDQKYFFIDEYNTAYIKLKRGQQYLFDQAPGFRKTMIMNTTSGDSFVKDFQYNAANKQVTFELPEQIATQTDYEVMIKLVPPSDNNVANNIKEEYVSQNLDKSEEGNEVSVRSNTLSGTAIKAVDRDLLDYKFRTSEYTTFDKKMKAVNKDDDLYVQIPFPYGLALSTQIDPVEPFDITELEGSAYSGHEPLLVATAILEDSYYKNHIYPLLYQEYPLENRFSVTRDTEKVGVPPIEGVEPLSWYLTSIENDLPTHSYNDFLPYRYNLTLYYLQDFEDLRIQIINSDISWVRKNEYYYDLVVKSFPHMRKGNYKTKLEYKLPGQLQYTARDIRKYYNPLYDEE